MFAYELCTITIVHRFHARLSPKLTYTQILVVFLVLVGRFLFVWNLIPFISYHENRAPDSPPLWLCPTR